MLGKDSEYIIFVEVTHKSSRKGFKEKEINKSGAYRFLSSPCHCSSGRVSDAKQKSKTLPTKCKSDTQICRSLQHLPSVLRLYQSLASRGRGTADKSARPIGLTSHLKNSHHPVNRRTASLFKCALSALMHCHDVASRVVYRSCGLDLKSCAAGYVMNRQ